MKPTPRIADVPVDYPIHLKGDWRGVRARAFGALLWLGLNMYDSGFVIAYFCSASLASFALGPAPIILAVFAYVLAHGAGAKRAARNVWDNYTIAIGGRAYVNDVDAVAHSTILHEGVHIWQAHNNRFHALRYSLDPRGLPFPVLREHVATYRAHAEAQAYAIEVALRYRSAASAARALVAPIYATGLDDDAALALIQEYARAWR